jgi:hypothetical protein
MAQCHQRRNKVPYYKSDLGFDFVLCVCIVTLNISFAVLFFSWAVSGRFHYVDRLSHERMIDDE